jgi:hypothetical protein
MRDHNVHFLSRLLVRDDHFMLIQVVLWIVDNAWAVTWPPTRISIRLRSKAALGVSALSRGLAGWRLA